VLLSCRRVSPPLVIRDLIAGHHAGQHMVADMAVEEPDARRVGHHVGSDHLRGKDVQDVGALAGHGDRIAVPVGRVRVVEVAERRDVPAHVIALVHDHHRHVAVDIAIDRPFDVGGRKAGGGDGAGHAVGRERAEISAMHAIGIGGVLADSMRTSEEPRREFGV
jgi:hypothetical protein